MMWMSGSDVIFRRRVRRIKAVKAYSISVVPPNAKADGFKRKEGDSLIQYVLFFFFILIFILNYVIDQNVGKENRE